MVLFSVLKPGVRIPPHNGFLNSRLICHLPLIVSASKKIYGEDLLARLPVSAYLEEMGQRPTVQKVNAERKANLPLMAAAYAK